LLGGEHHRLDACRRERLEEGFGHCRIDLYPADVEAIAAAAVDDLLARTVVARGGVIAAVVGAQAPPAMPAGGQPLKQGAAFPHRAASLMGTGPGVLPQPGLIGFIGLPVDVARVMLADEHRPLLAGQLAHPLADVPRLVHIALLAALAIGISARIHRVGEHLVDGVVGGAHPANLRQGDRL
jgi:hypothetical protein